MTRQSIEITPEVYEYILGANRDEHPVLKLCREETAQHVRSNLQIGLEQANLMQFLIRMMDARIAIEIGVFTGYSALLTTLTLVSNAGPGAKLFALDVSKSYLETASKYWQMAKVEKYIEPIVGEAIDSLNKLLESGYKARVDFIFIDADKKNNQNYYELAKKLIRPGGLIIIDNALRMGAVADENNMANDVVATREIAQFIKNDKEVEMCLIGTGDGLILAKKKH